MERAVKLVGDDQQVILDQASDLTIPCRELVAAFGFPVRSHESLRQPHTARRPAPERRSRDRKNCHRKNDLRAAPAARQFLQLPVVSPHWA